MDNKFSKIWNILSGIVMVTMLVTAVSARAATVTSANDIPSTLENGVAANHLLVFTIPGNIDEGDTLTISFDPGFDTSTILENDVDIEDDGLNLTTAVNCTDTEAASINIVANTVTFTICTGDGGSIVAGSEVTVKIGTNASASGLGTNQIVNPNNEGTYFLSISGTFGDSGSIALPIGNNDGISVSARVLSHGGGSPTPGGCSDHVAPTISGVVVSSVTTNSATISWSTDESTDGVVDYGLNDTYELGSKTDTSMTTYHSLNLNDLNEGSEYHFRVNSSDVCFNKTSSTDYLFTTLDNTAPIISEVAAVDVTETSARIIWITNESSTSQVEFGTSLSYGTTVSDGTLETEHSIIIIGLNENTTYNFRVSSSDISGNNAVSTNYSFTTAYDNPPGNVSEFTATAGDGQVKLSWALPTDDDLAGVLIIVCLNEYPSGVTDTDCSEIFIGLDVSFVHSGLTNDTVYYYGAFAFDTSGQYASGALARATPFKEIPDVCGDTICSGEETAFSCPADCFTEEKEMCGNGICAVDETALSCPIDCETTGDTPEEDVDEENPDQEETTCGNKICEITESVFTCPLDCLLTEEPLEEEISTVTCGNAICENGETSDSCASDCSLSEIPETTVPEEKLIPLSDISFFASEKALELLFADGVVETLAKTKISITISNEHIIKEIKDIKLFIGAETYLFSFNQKAYSADVTVPATATRHALYIVINYADGTSQTMPFVLKVNSSGLIFENLDKQQIPVDGTLVTLYVFNGVWTVWDGSPWLQKNPVTTENNGLFQWYVENGTYKVVTKKNGYDETDSGSLNIINRIVNPQIKIVKQPLTIISATETTKEVIANVIETTTQVVEAIRESPAVQTTATVAVPVVTAGLAASAIILTTSFDLLPFLQLIFTSPLLLFKRRKRKAYGVVYHAFTKKPIDLAIIRLYRISDNKLVVSRVTDQGGRYFFMVQPGNYRLEVTKKDFVFPSHTLRQIKDDAIYLDVYHGEPITVSDKNTIITPNIPLEPTEISGVKTPREIQKTQLLRRLQKWGSITGLLISSGIFLIYFSIWSATLLGIQIAVYLLVRRLATPVKPKSWGIVYDKTTGRPLARVIVRIFEPKYHKLLETWITDSKGRYTFILGPNQYSSTFEKTGYQPTEISPIDLSQNKDVTNWAQDIELSVQTPIPPTTNS